jgi:hypothetical protein
MPVWILLQGQAEQQKILLKLKQRIYVGHEDGPQAIEYYNAEVQKVLTSRNYRFLTPQKESPSPNVIVVAPDAQCEGERAGALSHQENHGFSFHALSAFFTCHK